MLHARVIRGSLLAALPCGGNPLCHSLTKRLKSRRCLADLRGFVRAPKHCCGNAVIVGAHAADNKEIKTRPVRVGRAVGSRRPKEEAAALDRATRAYLHSTRYEPRMSYPFPHRRHASLSRPHVDTPLLHGHVEGQAEAGGAERCQQRQQRHQLAGVHPTLFRRGREIIQHHSDQPT